MRTVVLGGSFNPPHIGHLQLASELRHAGYQRIIFVPSNISAHKENNKRLSSEKRLEMTRIAAREVDGIVEDCEILRGGVSYTIDTISFLYTRYDVKGKIAIVIGDDLIPGFHKWRRAGELVTKCELVVAHRERQDELQLDYPHRYLDNVILPISSTLIRNLAEQGRSYRFLVPKEIFGYIEEHKLYKNNG